MTKTEDRQELIRQGRREYMREYRKKMTDEQKEQERRYMRAWRKNNPDKVRRHQEDFLIRKSLEAKAEK